MSVINRIEIANFLNLDNVDPRSRNWSTDYPHLLLNIRGQSAAIVATNGMGKSTLNRAIYCMLTRDHAFAQATKAVCAPKRAGVYTHVRLELLYRDQPVGGLLGQMGALVPGEPYVFGIYGNYDSELTFYYYHGHLEDCPCVERDGARIRIVPNQQFRDRLRQQKETHPNLTREGSAELVAKHFDPAMLAQLLAYQKAGGGDSAEEFFRVRQRRPDGQIDEYDAAFFYEYIAPEVLANAMQGFGKDDETRFEDTILNSAGPLMRAELKNEKLAVRLDKDKRTFRELEAVRAALRDFGEARGKQDALVASLGGEVAFLLDVTERRPLPGLPPVLADGAGEQTRQVANALVLQDGQWLIPDGLIAALMGAETSNVNLEAARLRLAATKLERRQAIEIPCNSLFSMARSGPPGKAYGLEAALHLVQARTGAFAEGWDRDSALRALRYGFEYRTKDGDTNPFRRAVAALAGRMAELQAERAGIASLTTDLRTRQSELVGRITTLEADAHELKLVRDSGLFSADELAALEETAARVPAEAKDAAALREGHERRWIELNHGREAYHSFVADYGPGGLPRDVLDCLTAERDDKQEQAAMAAAVAEQAATTEAETAAAAAAARAAHEEKFGERLRLEALLEPVERFEQAFAGENPAGLADEVRRQRDDAVAERAQLAAAGAALEAERDRLAALADDARQFSQSFPGEDPVGLEAKVVQRLHHIDGRLAALPEEQRRQAALVERLRTNRDALRRAEAVAGGRPLIGLETALRDEHRQALDHAGQARALLAQADADRATLDRFAARFGAADPADIRTGRTARLSAASAELAGQQAAAAGFRRQLAELEQSATAAGRIACEVLEAVGGTPRRVHEVIDQEVAASPRRAALLTHFSHVLHAPVAETAAEAERMLADLERRDLEAPIFWLEGLRDFCRHAPVACGDGIALGVLAGTATRQVKGLIDPHEVERTREQILARLAETEATVARLEQERRDLDEASDDSQLVRDACHAAGRGVAATIADVQAAASAAEADAARLAALLNEDGIRILRQAEHFVQEGGDAHLAAEEARLAALADEYARLGGERPAAAARASATAVALIGHALHFRRAGGDDRLAAVQDQIAAAAARLAHIDAALPRLEDRVARIPDIDAAARFAADGGRAALAHMLADLDRLKQAHATADSAHRAAIARRQDADAALTACRAAAAAAELALARAEPVLRRAQDYVDAGGLDFDAAFDDRLDELKQAEERAARRAGFRFGMALFGLRAEQEGRSVETLQAEHDRLEREVRAGADRLAAIEDALAGLEPQLDRARDNMKRLDKVVHELIARRRQAVQAASGIDLPATLPAAGGEVLGRAVASAERVRQAVGEDVDEAILDELEALQDDIEGFQLEALKPQIDDARRRKDACWTAFGKACLRVRNDTSLSLSPPERSMLDEALTGERPQRLEVLFTAFEQHVADQQRVFDQAREDIENERQKLSESLEAFTFQVEDHFRLLKSCLKPSADGSEAGFELEASVLGRDGIRQAVDRVIALIKKEEKRRAEDAEDGTDRAQATFERQIKEEIRRTFYRAVFAGKKDEHGRENASGPRVFLRHPRIGKGERMRLTKKISTGQSNALALLLMTKMADFAIHRDERDRLATAGRRRGAAHQTRVVMIDGLFSNVSNRKLIRESLDALRTLKGKFQLIGWIHNEAYENDPEIFPEHLALRRIGDGDGYVVADKIIDPAEDTLTLGNGAVDVVELHVDELMDDLPEPV